MVNEQRISMWGLLKGNRQKVAATWALVLVENVMLALIPLFIGFSIDSLQAGDYGDLFVLGLVMLALCVVGVLRRFYDTRVYGAMRVELGLLVSRLNTELPVSTRSARLDMSRELIDFLEEKIPELITGTIQIVVALIVLFSFSHNLAGTAALIGVVMILTYGMFHNRFFRLNKALNSQIERQVAIMQKNTTPTHHLARHLTLLKKWEIKLSDTEALLYGLIFVGVTGFIIANLWLAMGVGGITVGAIFSIVTYSWEYIGAALVLPDALQNLTRLNEITHRLNAAS